MESDARTRVVGYLDRRGADPKYGDLIHWITGANPAELSMSDLRDVLADADRDHRFAEAVRKLFRSRYSNGVLLSHADLIAGVSDWHMKVYEAGIYSAPCAANASNASVNEEGK